MSNIECVVDCRNTLGEVPVWDVQEQALYWVDIEGKLLQRLIPSTGDVSRWEMPERISSFALREQGGLIVAFASGIALYDLDTAAIEWIAKPEAGLPGNRFNEGKCDRKGRFWAGAMDDSLSAHTAGLYRVDADHTVHKILSDIGISNCFVWSRDNDRFWFADTLDKTVYTFDYDHERGAISNRQVFMSTESLDCGPDGGTIDEEGFIWIALWDGWRIARFAPDGTLDREIQIPAQKPTSCMFGGPDFSTLYVTTAIWDLKGEALEAQPHAGGLFAIDAGVRGLPETRFAG
jgi:sugar lactone lactonase YvrE